MSKTQNFYVCEKCGNVVELIHNGGGQLVCCGQPMLELVPGVVEAAVEKHIPDFKVNGNKVEVQVGSVEHPMLDEHWIEWISITDGETSQRVDLNPGEVPKATFEIDTTKPFTIYAFCNLHGLWKAEK